MLISVIIPVFNSAKYLNECVKSVENDYENLQIILVDDGSNDGSSELCDELARKNSKIEVIHKANGGVSSARNAALERIKGDFVAFIDSDDSIQKGYFTNMLEKIGDADILILSLKHHKVKKPFAMSGKKALEFMLKDQKHGFGWAPWGKLYKKEIIGALRFDEREHVTEDFSFNSKVLMDAKKVRFDTGGLYNYQENENSIMRSTYNEKYDSMILVGDNFLKLCKERDKSLAPLAYLFIANSTIFLIYKARDARLYDKVFAFSARLRGIIFKIIFNRHCSLKFKLVAIAHAFFQKILLLRK